MVEFNYSRRVSREVRVGDIGIGGDNPVRVQTMITAPTRNIVAAVAQIIDLHKNGAEIIRVTTPSLADVYVLDEISRLLKEGYERVPLVADVHHQGSEIAKEAAKRVQKVRLNPGLNIDTGRKTQKDYTALDINLIQEKIFESLGSIAAICKEYGTAIRVGVNHGSLSNRIMYMYGDSPQGMVESAMEYITGLESYGFKDIVVSLKASRVPVMLAANRLMVERMTQKGMDYPMHLGVTEAGNAQEGRIKSALGIGVLLEEGIGDTIRASLTEDPVNELSVCYDILQGLGMRITKPEYIACPGCGRTQFDINQILSDVKLATKDLSGVSIGVMGCNVNGPGEMADANFGVTGVGGGRVALYLDGEMVETVRQEEAVDCLLRLISNGQKSKKRLPVLN